MDRNYINIITSTSRLFGTWRFGQQFLRLVAGTFELVGNSKWVNIEGGHRLGIHLHASVFDKDYFTITFFTFPLMYLMMLTPFCKISIGFPSIVYI